MMWMAMIAVGGFDDSDKGPTRFASGAAFLNAEGDGVAHTRRMLTAGVRKGS
jgi:hypothetical protein